MKNNKTNTKVDQYISEFDPIIQNRLKELQNLFFEVLPNTKESIRYKIPAYEVGNHYLYFAGYKNHIGFYPVYGLDEIEDELSEYRAKGTKDSLHFLHSKPLPIELIKKIIELKSKQVNTTNLNPEVTKLLNDLNLPLIDCVELLRKTILKSNPNLEENIKWNSPNYTLIGNDLITLKVQPSKTNVQIIFHRGAKVKSQPKTKIIPEDSKLLVWKSNDRAVATFTNISEITINMDLIEMWVKIWLEYKDKKE